MSELQHLNDALGLPVGLGPGQLASPADLTPPPVDAAQFEDAARQEAATHIEAAFAPAAPGDFKPDYVGRIAPGMTAEGMAEFHQEATTWAASLALPASIGAAVIERAMDVGQGQSRLSGPERDYVQAEQRSLFDRISGGPERGEERRAAVADMLSRASAGFTVLLRQCGALNDAMVLLQLANHADRLAASGR